MEKFVFDVREVNLRFSKVRSIIPLMTFFKEFSKMGLLNRADDGTMAMGEESVQRV